jgi:hypothetical protein
MYPRALPSRGFFIKKKPPCTHAEWALSLGFRSRQSMQRCAWPKYRSLLNQADEVESAARGNFLMRRLLRLLFLLAVRSFRCRRELLVENLALRRQLVILKRRHPQPQVPFIVQPETVVRWRHAGFKLYWAQLSRSQIIAADDGPRLPRDLEDVFRR